MQRLLALSILAVLALPFPAAGQAGSARELYKRASPAVVVVFATDGSSAGGSVGTGSLISSDGLVLTNYHVIATDGKVAPNVAVFFRPSEVTGVPQKDLVDGVAATVLAASPGWDLALLAIPASRAKDRLALGITRERAQPGDPAIAIGHPEDGGLWTLTSGIISNRIPDFDAVQGKHVYQMQTPINPGNSGGPLLDSDGNLVGVNTAAVKVGKSGLPIAEIQFAVAADVVLAFLDAAIEALVSGRTAVAKQEASPAASGSGSEAQPGAAQPLSGKIALLSGGGRRNVAMPPPPPPPPGIRPAGAKRAIQSDFQTPKKPYDKAKLFDFVRGQAKKAFDDLDAEVPD